MATPISRGEIDQIATFPRPVKALGELVGRHLWRNFEDGAAIDCKTWLRDYCRPALDREARYRAEGFFRGRLRDGWSTSSHNRFRAGGASALEGLALFDRERHKH